MVVCLYYGVLYEDTGILTVMYALGILVIVSILEIVARFFTFRCYSQIPISMAEIGKPIELLIKTQNKGFFPVGKVRVRVSVRNALNKVKETSWHTLPGVPLGNSQYRELYKYLPIYNELTAYESPKICIITENPVWTPE